MLHVEAVIKMLDPTFNLRRIAVKRSQPNPCFKRGTVYRRAVDVLGTATEPLTAREIAERVLVAAKIERPDKVAPADLIGTVLASLRNHQGKGVERANEGSPAKWRLAINWCGTRGRPRAPDIDRNDPPSGSPLGKCRGDDNH
jgi:hypothetical protein